MILVLINQSESSLTKKMMAHGRVFHPSSKLCFHYFYDSMTSSESSSSAESVNGSEGVFFLVRTRFQCKVGFGSSLVERQTE